MSNVGANPWMWGAHSVCGPLMMTILYLLAGGFLVDEMVLIGVASFAMWTACGQLEYVVNQAQRIAINFQPDPTHVFLSMAISASLFIGIAYVILRNFVDNKCNRHVRVNTATYLAVIGTLVGKFLLWAHCVAVYWMPAMTYTNASHNMWALGLLVKIWFVVTTIWVLRNCKGGNLLLSTNCCQQARQWCSDNGCEWTWGCNEEEGRRGGRRNERVRRDDGTDNEESS